MKKRKAYDLPIFCFCFGFASIENELCFGLGIDQEQQLLPREA
jgi:hypothetical protein